MNNKINWITVLTVAGTACSVIGMVASAVAGVKRNEQTLSKLVEKHFEDKN